MQVSYARTRVATRDHVTNEAHCTRITPVRDMPFSDKKALAQECLAAAYSHDYLTVVEYEQRVQELEAAETFDQVDRLVEDLPQDLVEGPAALELARHAGGVVGPEQVLEGSSQVVRKRGTWIRSNRIVINHRGSTMRLRFDQLRELPDARILLQVDLQGCMCRIHVPRGTRVVEDLQSHGSMIRISRRLSRSEVSYGPMVVLQGEIRGTVLRVTPL